MTEIFANPFTFVHMVEIAALVILAVILARIIIAFSVVALVFVFGLIGGLIALLFSGFNGNRARHHKRR